jgi:poly(A) polymerase
MTRLTDAWVSDSRTQMVCALLTNAGYQALFVGGCVRNALLGQPVADIDIATDAVPERVMALTAAAGLKAVPTGIDHGTVTVVADHAPFEVTTFRRDVATDGRRATVAYATDMAEDAARRDFTMNALYARSDGSVLDPLGGLPDLRAGRVRFVGDPARRIAEDYLRILRFFRFHAWYGHPGDGLDADGLAACAAARDGLARLSRERIGAEITRLLEAPDPAPALGPMAAAGILAAVLPGADPAAIGPLVHFERAAGLSPDRHRRLAALGPQAAPGWAEDLRLSRADRKRLDAIAAAMGGDPAASAYRHGAEAARDAALVAAASLGAPPPTDLAALVTRGAAARFPLRAADLPALKGPALGAALKRLEADWIASGFALDRAALLSRA